MGSLLIGHKNREFIEFEEKGQNEMYVFSEDYEGNQVGKFINREQAIQIIQHLQDQFQIKK